MLLARHISLKPMVLENLVEINFIGLIGTQNMAGRIFDINIFLSNLS